MKREIADRWVAALRSGEYVQGKRWLRRGQNFCCLGVLCDLYSKETGIQWQIRRGTDIFGGHDLALPNEVVDWAGMSSPSGKYEDTLAPANMQADLSAWNDFGAPFTKIADIIEKNVERL